jgi:hypothetical protein
MKMRYIAAGLAVAMVLAGGAAAALAGPRHEGWRDGPPCGGDFYGIPDDRALDPEQKAAVEELFRKHYQAVEPLRQQLYAKRLEWEALAGNSNASPEAVGNLAREIAQLDSDLRRANLDFREELRKNENIRLPPAYGRGHDRDYGRGRMHDACRGWRR